MGPVYPKNMQDLTITNRHVCLHQRLQNLCLRKNPKIWMVIVARIRSGIAIYPSRRVPAFSQGRRCIEVTRWQIPEWYLSVIKHSSGKSPEDLAHGKIPKICLRGNSNMHLPLPCLMTWRLTSYTVDACEILHRQTDGWNPINYGMFTTSQQLIPISSIHRMWCRQCGKYCQ